MLEGKRKFFEIAKPFVHIGYILCFMGWFFASIRFLILLGIVKSKVKIFWSNNSLKSSWSSLHRFDLFFKASRSAALHVFLIVSIFCGSSAFRPSSPGISHLFPPYLILPRLITCWHRDFVCNWISGSYNYALDVFVYRSSNVQGDMEIQFVRGTILLFDFFRLTRMETHILW